MADPMLNKLKHHWNVSSRREFFTEGQLTRVEEDTDVREDGVFD